jgi:uncharacterized protein (TIGR00725 family)
MRVSVIGGSEVSRAETDVAATVGRRLAERGHTVVCGGRGGVMAAVCRGASEKGGHTVGILPGTDPRAANRYVETAVATGLGHARNVLVIMNGDAVIAVDGGPGTLSEIGFAATMGRPVAGLRTHEVEYVEPVDTPNEAIKHVERATGHVG